jgi:hypothetical protein
MVQNAVEHGGGKHGVAGEGLVPAAEAEVGRQHQRALLITASDDLEEQIGLLAPNSR